LYINTTQHFFFITIITITSSPFVHSNNISY
jgi:hypothetical protein